MACLSAALLKKAAAVWYQSWLVLLLRCVPLEIQSALLYLLLLFFPPERRTKVTAGLQSEASVEELGVGAWQKVLLIICWA